MGESETFPRVIPPSGAIGVFISQLQVVPEGINSLALPRCLVQLAPARQPKKYPQHWRKQPEAMEVDTEGYEKTWQCLLLI